MYMNNDDFKETLTPEQYHILRERGTEAPFTGQFLDHQDLNLSIREIDIKKMARIPVLRVEMFCLLLVQNLNLTADGRVLIEIWGRGQSGFSMITVWE